MPSNVPTSTSYPTNSPLELEEDTHTSLIGLSFGGVSGQFLSDGDVFGLERATMDFLLQYAHGVEILKVALIRIVYDDGTSIWLADDPREGNNRFLESDISASTLSSFVILVFSIFGRSSKGVDFYQGTESAIRDNLDEYLQHLSEHGALDTSEVFIWENESIDVNLIERPSLAPSEAPSVADTGTPTRITITEVTVAATVAAVCIFDLF